MPDEITITQKTDSDSTPAATAPENQTATSVRTQLTTLCALGLGMSFFLPWANILSVNISGFDLQKAGNEQLLLWLIPICCAITIVVGIYWYCKFSNDLFQILSYGAYLSLIFGAAIFILPRKSK